MEAVLTACNRPAIVALAAAGLWLRCRRLLAPGDGRVSETGIGLALGQLMLENMVVQAGRQTAFSDHLLHRHRHSRLGHLPQWLRDRAFCRIKDVRRDQPRCPLSPGGCEIRPRPTTSTRKSG